MSTYTRMLREFSEQHRPRALARLADPETFFAEQGALLEARVAAVRDDLLGGPRPGETAEQHRSRSSQAWRTAEELVLADTWLLVPDTEPEAEGDLTRHEDPDVAAYYQDLQEISRLTADPDL